MVAVDFATGPAYEVVIAGHSRSEDTKETLRALMSEFLPNTVVLCGPRAGVPDIDRISGFTNIMKAGIINHCVCMQKP
jgi:hypothetical protein